VLPEVLKFFEGFKFRNHTKSPTKDQSSEQGDAHEHHIAGARRTRGQP